MRQRGKGWWVLACTVLFLHGVDACAQVSDSCPGIIADRPPADLANQLPPEAKLRLRNPFHFTTGGTGPGINHKDCPALLNGALDPKTGWPFVLLDHFAPRPERVSNLWVVQTRGCPQDLGTDPWPCLKVLHFDARGNLVECDPRDLLAQVAGRPVYVHVHGNLATADFALGGLLWTHSWLDFHHALPADGVVIGFDWPSQKIDALKMVDVNDKGRRASVAAYHLARFLQAFPPNSRVCLLGHSYGGWVVSATLHLLAGGVLKERRGPSASLPGPVPELRLHTVVIGGALDHDDLDPGQPFGQAMTACEAFLNLYTRKDRVMLLYPFLLVGYQDPALGRVGFTAKDLKRLGSLAAKIEQHDIYDLIGREHTLLRAVIQPEVAAWIAPYTWATEH